MARAKNPTSTRLPRPLPYDDRMQRKPLWDVIAQTFENARRPDLTTNGRAR
jgi:endo-1,4-beta-xylanase